MIIKMPESVRGQAKAQSDRCFEEGVEAHNRGDEESAAELYKRAISLHPGASGAMVNLGSIYFSKGDLVTAESFFRSAIEVCPEYALAHFDLASLLDKCGNIQGALGHYLRAVQYSPRYADAHFNLALLYQDDKIKEYEKASKHWRKYIELDPVSDSSRIARRELAKLELKSGKPVLVPLPRSTSA